MDLHRSLSVSQSIAGSSSFDPPSPRPQRSAPKRQQNLLHARPVPVFHLLHAKYWTRVHPVLQELRLVWCLPRGSSRLPDHPWTQSRARGGFVQQTFAGSLHPALHVVERSRGSQRWSLSHPSVLSPHQDEYEAYC